MRCYLREEVGLSGCSVEGRELSYRYVREGGWLELCLNKGGDKLLMTRRKGEKQIRRKEQRKEGDVREEKG